MTSPALEKALFRPFSRTMCPESTAQALQQPLLSGWESWHADPVLCMSAKVCLKRVIQ